MAGSGEGFWRMYPSGLAPILSLFMTVCGWSLPEMIWQWPTWTHLLIQHSCFWWSNKMTAVSPALTTAPPTDARSFPGERLHFTLVAINFMKSGQQLWQHHTLPDRPSSFRSFFSILLQYITKSKNGLEVHINDTKENLSGARPTPVVRFCVVKNRLEQLVSQHWLRITSTEAEKHPRAPAVSSTTGSWLINI